MAAGPLALPAGRRTDYGHDNGNAGTCRHATAYGLTCTQYEAMRDRARDCCELCATPGPETGRGALVIDHFSSKKVSFVRGLLCDRCNALMARHDGTAPWGPSTEHRRDEARTYHLAAFAAPTAEQYARADEVIAERCRALATRFEPRPVREAPPVDPVLQPIADDLLSRLHPDQVARLAVLLLSHLQ
ncbi:endonuclease VII domain-containing protein [Streptomyces sp. NBC_01420]|uniref:endonuclease domain-containing protein n=1 Tax=Streptomyces sp. NBC_01420 TaxID=2903858 RepID=UPI00324FD708